MAAFCLVQRAWGCQQLNNYELQIRLYACSPRCAPGYRFHPAAFELMILLWWEEKMNQGDNSSKRKIYNQ